MKYKITIKRNNDLERCDEDCPHLKETSDAEVGECMLFKEVVNRDVRNGETLYSTCLDCDYLVDRAKLDPNFEAHGG